MNRLKEVELVSTGVYLPGEPVPFDKIEDVIGRLDQAPPRIQKMINKLRPTVKDLIGIEQCHFAVDKETKRIFENNTTMATKAINKALEKAQLKTNDLDCMVIATPVPEQQTPPLTTLVQEALGIKHFAEIEIHSNCTGLTKAFQVAYDMLRLGRYKQAVVVYTQLSSPYLVSSYYNQSKVGMENILLRWFLSDSASAVILRAKDKVKSGIKVLDSYNESVGGDVPPAMWLKFGAKHWDLLRAYEEGLHHLGQNYKTVTEIGYKYLVDGFKRMTDRIKLDMTTINHLLATIPSTKLQNTGKQAFQEQFSISYDKWYSNIDKKGYSGGSSVAIALDQMIDEKKFKPDELLVAMTIESSKWMFGGFILKYL